MILQKDLYTDILNNITDPFGKTKYINLHKIKKLPKRQEVVS